MNRDECLIMVDQSLRDDRARSADIPVEMRARRDQSDAVGEVFIVYFQLWKKFSIDALTAGESRITRSKDTDVEVVVVGVLIISCSIQALQW